MTHDDENALHPPPVPSKRRELIMMQDECMFQSAGQWGWWLDGNAAKYRPCKPEDQATGDGGFFDDKICNRDDALLE